MKKENKKYALVSFEITLLILSSFAFVYLLRESLGDLNLQKIEIKENKTSFLFVALSFIGKLIFGSKGLVSAVGLPGINTCLKTKDGKICQEYTSDTCAANCNTTCIPSKRDDVLQCKLGTCYDSVEGTCQPSSPKEACESNRGTWYDDPFGNVLVCKQGCCEFSGRTLFTTNQACQKIGATSGVTVKFKPEIQTEISCLILSNMQEEGACVFKQELENTCKFSTKSGCLQLKGTFYSGMLCSNSALNTNCRKQANTKCIDGKDEVYWFDSCGNRENIYDANKEKSWNLGRILSKAESCALNVGSNNYANQGTCGNCNYLLGSKCGAESGSQKLGDTTQDVVCRDLSCIDDKGNKRDHGESWCAYQSSVGVDGNRGSDTPGSRNFRKVCIDGEIRTEPCADFRNEICIQSSTAIPGGTFDSAACRVNRGYECYNYNQAENKDECTKNPDCYIKNVYVSPKFNFDFCLPKYKPGFDINSRAEGSASICKMGTQTCKYVKVKGVFGGGQEINRECLTETFTQQMNDFCMSLGDCGGQVNYLGDYSENYRVSNAPKLSESYVNGIKKYADESQFLNKPIPVGDIGEFYGELGIPGFLGSASAPEDKSAAVVKMTSLISGGLGVILMIGAKLYGGAILAGLLSVAPGAVSATAGGGAFTGVATSATVGAAGGTVAVAFASALAGAALGAGVVTLLLQVTGVGAGLPPALTYGLIAAGAAAGALIGLAKIGVISANFGPAGWIVLAVIVVFIIILKIFGIGKKKEIVVTFTCKAWQPPVGGGGNCKKCGSDGLICSKYACQSLGQTCELINEGSGNPECIDISPNDASPPVITPMQGVLPDGYAYEELESGVRIKTTQSDGCIRETYTPIPFSISLSEPGRCKFSTSLGKQYDDMENDFGASGFFLRNQTLPIIIPSLASLGEDGLKPNITGTYNLYIKCEDKRGNKNLRDFAINFCIKPGPDSTPPIIQHKEPELEILSFGATNVNVSVFTNEPATCAYDITDKEYSSMTGNFSCLTNYEDREIYGWRCNSILPIVSNDNTFYVRCKDQPFLINKTLYKFIVENVINATNNQLKNVSYSYQDNINYNELNAARGRSVTGTVTNITYPETIAVNLGNGENSTQGRNSNTQSYLLNFKRSLSQLKIDYITPNNITITSNIEPTSVEVSVGTSGGIDGTARCYYSWGNLSNYIEFRFGSWTNTHKQVFQSLYPGKVTLPVKCEDLAGNTALKTTEFNILLDTEIPRVTRVYQTNGDLNVVTNEPATCAYDKNSCDFAFENGTMFIGNDFEHITNFNQFTPYYVKCKDKFNQVPGSCSVIVRKGFTTKI